MSDLTNSLSNAYDITNAVRNRSLETNGLYNWNDAWSNFMINYALSDYEYRTNKEMWDLMNQYNTPASQMQRFIDAGLNPNLIYQQGTPGNASSAVQYKAPNINFTPRKNEQEIISSKLNNVLQIFGAVNDLCQNIGNMIDTGLNIQLKRNELQMSNQDLYAMQHVFGAPGSGTSGINLAQPYLSEALNPWSNKFDILAYQYLSRYGGLPQFANQYLTADAQRALTQYRSQYQEAYNSKLLPLFEQYQSGKITAQDLQNGMLEYNQTALQMLPPELRGILEPVFHWLSPFFKFIFKQNKITH